MCLAFHSPVPIEHSVFADNFDHALRLDITAGRSNHNLKFTSFDHPLVISVRKIQHINRDGETHRGFLPGLQGHPLKGLQFLYGANQ
jgi:hypothetical protein